MINILPHLLAKKHILLYSSTFVVTGLLGLVSILNVEQRSTELSFGLLFFSLVFYFILFFVVETNRIYQFFQTIQFRLLPISTQRLYLYNVLFSLMIGVLFFIGNMIVGVIVQFLLVNVDVYLLMTWQEFLITVLEMISLFLSIQFIFYLSLVFQRWVQKSIRLYLGIGLFLLLGLLLNHLSFFISKISKDFLVTVFGVSQKNLVILSLQSISIVGYFILTTWIINQFIEAEGR
ncbi:hypothetical protein [Candidatus Enterococcus mansonii]|uniref:Uncharacterized protein n=1 Tax=Candidatus Enterococcus mansonii TaxID=1834181 RepID=A0A242C5G5_9ENTE|nr:hypothetical protein [Enterococcus sp. 4G2_DIV0659]OTO05495.1 hypothetical protein A5880_002668 [Enterococcus sp. 4G2_DIV0659]